MNIFWFRRDLRLTDNHALYQALSNGNTIPVFIFDTKILFELPRNDARVSFIHQTLSDIQQQLQDIGKHLEVYIGSPGAVWLDIIRKYQPTAVYFNKDYEPYAKERDKKVSELLAINDIECYALKDQVIFEENDVLKADETPYTVYTPYKNKWKSQLKDIPHYPSEDLLDQLSTPDQLAPFPSLDQIGFVLSPIEVHPYSFEGLENYDKERDFPALDNTTYASVHLRFGTISVRQALRKAQQQNKSLVNELIWREFFMQILYHFPHVQRQAFKAKYKRIPWRNNEEEFKKWCEGKTGYALVDAGMRQLNQTGYMHNRVRMVVASFLCKHLLIDWKWGEAYFAQKLLDYDLSANNGNWQWAAGCGCDAAPYFRVFNPITQLKKFDKDLIYVRQWVKEYDELTYPLPMVDHKQARERCLTTYKTALNDTKL